MTSDGGGPQSSDASQHATDGARAALADERPAQPGSPQDAATANIAASNGANIAASAHDRRPPRTTWTRALWLGVALFAIGCIGALLAAPSVNREYLRLGHWSTDWRSALLSPRLTGPHDRIAIVTINDATLRDYISSPIDRGLLARIVTAVDAAGPRAIGIDVLFLKRTNPAHDEALVAAIRNAKSTVILGAEDERGRLEAFQRKYQTEFIASTGRKAGYFNLRRQPDDVVRFTAPPLAGGAYPESFARLLAEAGGATIVSDASRPIAWMLGRDDDMQPFTMLPAQDLLHDPDLGAQIKGRVVIIGGDFQLRDRHRVPLTVRTGQHMPGAVIHGEIMASMLEPKNAVRELDPLAARIFVLVVAVAGMALGWLFGLGAFVTYLGWGFATGLLVAADAFAYRYLYVLLPFVLAAMAWVAGITAGRGLRLASRSEPT